MDVKDEVGEFEFLAELKWAVTNGEQVFEKILRGLTNVADAFPEKTEGVQFQFNHAEVKHARLAKAEFERIEVEENWATGSNSLVVT